MEKEYATTAISIISDAKILQPEDLNAVSDLAPELLDNFLYSQIFRTRTEMEVSVLNDTKFPTPDSKYWQAQREQRVHFHELVMLSYEYRKNQAEIRKLKKEQVKFATAEGKPDDSPDWDLLQIEIERRTYIARTMERTAKDRIQEIREWHEIKENLKPRMEHGLTDCDEHQLVSYTVRWLQQVRGMGQNGSPSERNNLLALLNMGVSKCIEKSLMGKVMGAFDERTCKQIRQNFDLDEFNRPVKRIG
jgi:hypothetical protein